MLTVSVTISDFVGQIENPPKMAIFEASCRGGGGLTKSKFKNSFFPLLVGPIANFWRFAFFETPPHVNPYGGGGVEVFQNKKIFVLGPSRHRSSCRVMSTCAIKSLVNP